MMPSCDQIGVPIHFHSSTTSGSASLIRLRILPRVSPRQSPSSAILFEMSSDADWPWPAPDFFMFSSWKFQKKGYVKFRRAGVAFGHSPSLGDDGVGLDRIAPLSTLARTLSCLKRRAVPLPHEPRENVPAAYAYSDNNGDEADALTKLSPHYVEHPSCSSTTKVDRGSPEEPTPNLEQ